MLRIKLIKSIIGHTPKNRATVKALGLGKVNSSRVHNDTPQIRGMVHHVKHLVSVETVEEGAGSPKTAPKPKKSSAKETE